MKKKSEGGFFDNFSGKFGDKVKVNNKYGSHLRKMAVFIDKKTEAQMNVREITKTLADVWSTFNNEDIENWNRLASYDNVKDLSKGSKITDGHSFFFCVNRNLLGVGEPIKNQADQPQYETFYATIRIELKEGKGLEDIKLYFEPAFDKGFKAAIYATGGMKGGKRFIDDKYYKQIGIIGEEFVSGSSILARYLQIHKEIEEGSRTIGFRFKIVSKMTGLCHGRIEIRTPLKSR